MVQLCKMVQRLHVMPQMVVQLCKVVQLLETMLQMVVQLCKIVPLCKMLQRLCLYCRLDIVDSKRLQLQMCIGLQHKWCYSRAMNTRGYVTERKRERNTEHTRTAQEHTRNESLQPSLKDATSPPRGWVMFHRKVSDASLGASECWAIDRAQGRRKIVAKTNEDTDRAKEKMTTR